jgi:hypothetical protein
VKQLKNFYEICCEYQVDLHNSTKDCLVTCLDMSGLICWHVEQGLGNECIIEKLNFLVEKGLLRLVENTYVFVLDPIDLIRKKHEAK